MKKILFIYSIFLLGWNAVKAQNIQFGYNFTASGSSLDLSYLKFFGRSGIGAGVGYNLNNYSPENGVDEFYKKKLYAENSLQHISLKLFYHYTFYQFKENTQLFSFYNFQLRRAGAKSRLLFGDGYDSTYVVNAPEEGILYREVIASYSPYYWLENTAGIGITTNLSEKLYLQQKVGLGITFILGKDEGSHIVNLDGYEWITGSLYNVSIGYRLD